MYYLLLFILYVYLYYSVCERSTTYWIVALSRINFGVMRILKDVVDERGGL